jgi:cyclase
MLKTRVIPTLLFKNPEVGLVKSIRFNRMRTVGNPVNAARVYNARNVDELIFLDIGARRDSRPINLQAVKEIFKECFMPLTVGGKIEKLQDVRALLLAGADKVSVNTAAIENPILISQISNSYGSQCLVVSIDAKRTPSGNYQVFSQSGRDPTGLDPVSWAKQVEKFGAGEILINSIDHDGTMAGYDLTLIKIVSAAVKIPVIAAGGAGTPNHFVEVIKKTDVSAAAAASIFHFTQYTPQSVKREMKTAGIPVRL